MVGIRAGLCALLSLLAWPAGAGTITVAAAASLQPVMDALRDAFADTAPDTTVVVVFASSGKLQAQIRQQAPFDLFLSADVAHAQSLTDDGFAAAPPVVYARGRLALWSAREDASGLSLSDLLDARFDRIAIASPRHAPYGQRAEEALRAAGVWAALAPRLVYGENIGQAAQFVASGNARVGLLALSQVQQPALSRRGGHAVVDADLHAPLDQAFVVIRRAADNAEVQAFAAFLTSARAAALFTRHGFEAP